MSTRSQRMVAGAAIAGLVFVAWMTRRAEAADSGDPSVAFVLCTPEGSAAVEKCGILGGPSAYDVPIGRRLIIEQVSGNCADDGSAGLPLTAKIVAKTQGVTLQHRRCERRFAWRTDSADLDPDLRGLEFLRDNRCE